MNICARYRWLRTVLKYPGTPDRNSWNFPWTVTCWHEFFLWGHLFIYFLSSIVCWTNSNWSKTASSSYSLDFSAFLTLYKYFEKSMNLIGLVFIDCFLRISQMNRDSIFKPECSWHKMLKWLNCFCSTTCLILTKMYIIIAFVITNTCGPFNFDATRCNTRPF